MGSDNPFRDLPQLMSPHVGASTTEAQKRIAESIATQTRALRGEVVDYPVSEVLYLLIPACRKTGCVFFAIY